MVQSNAAMKEELKLIQETEENLNQMINLMKSQTKEIEAMRKFLYWNFACRTVACFLGDVILKKFSCLTMEVPKANS